MVNTEPSDVPEDVIIVRGTPRIEIIDGVFIGIDLDDLNKHYPHYCCKKMGGCGKRLWFGELLVANRGLELKFISKTRDFLKETYKEMFNWHEYDLWGRSFGLWEFTEYIKKLWKNKNIEFLCCGCYAKATQPKFRGKSILQDSIDALASCMRVIQSRMIVSQDFEEFSKRFGNITERNGGFIDDVYGALRGEPNDDDPQLKDYIEGFKDDISEGTGIPREELFGSTEETLNELVNEVDSFLAFGDPRIEATYDRSRPPDDSIVNISILFEENNDPSV